MKILHYIDTLKSSQGGPVRAVLDLCHALAAKGHQITLVTGEFGDAPKHLSTPTPGLPTVRDISVHTGRSPRLASTSRKAIAALLPQHDLVHLHGMWSIANIQIANDARKANVPYVVTVRGMLDDWCMEQGKLHKRLFLAIWGRDHLERASTVHCTAAAELTQAQRWFPRGVGTVLPNLLDLTPFRNAPGPLLAHEKYPRLAQVNTSNGSNGSSLPDPTILFLSRIHKKKGVDTLLAAGAALKARKINFVIAIAGTGEPAYVDQMKAMATSLGIADRVVWTGHIGGPLKISLYQAATLFALPTHSENFGFVFPEALASGTPVLTTHGVDIWPELESSGAACILDPTATAFADCIAKLLTNPGELAVMRERAKPWVFREFDEANLVARYEAMYVSCMKK